MDQSLSARGATQRFPYLTIHENLRHHAAVRTEKIAVVYENRTFTFRQLFESSSRIAQGLQDAGIHRGDKVGIYLRNHWAYIPIYYAVSMLGAISVPINYMLRSEQLGSLLELTECKFLFTEMSQHDEVGVLQPERFETFQVCYVDEGPGTDVALLSEWLICHQGCEQFDVSVSIHDPMMILFSSGTTGLPKGIVLSHLNRILYFFELGMEYGLGYNDVNLCATPLYHNAAIFFAFNNLYFGSTTVVQRKFDPVQAFREIEKHRVTNAFLVPTQLHQLVQSEERAKFDVSSLRVIVSGAAPLATTTKEAIFKCFPGVELHEMYGLTETGLITNLRPEDQLRKVRCAGQAFLNMEFKVVDLQGNHVPVGEVGEIVTRGATLFDGYYRNEEITRKSWKKGWFHTGDLGRIDEEGYLYIVDRLKDMILSGGVNVYPKDIEDAIYTLPETDDVAVIGIPDEKWGEAVHAIVVRRLGTKLDPQDVISRCKQKLASFQVPRSVEFRTQLPRNPSGKLLKRVLREEFWRDKQAKSNG